MEQKSSKKFLNRMGRKLERYSAWSIVDKFRGYRGVYFSWFFVDRQWPASQVRELIADYEGIDPLKRSSALSYMRELFSFQELSLLRGYLQKNYGIELHVKQAVFPLKSFNSTGIIPAGWGVRFYQLSLEEDYDLPFRVWAYYDLSCCASKKDMLAAQKNCFGQCAFCH